MCRQHTYLYPKDLAKYWKHYEKVFGVYWAWRFWQALVYSGHWVEDSGAFHY